MVTTIIIIAIVAILVLWFIKVQRELVNKEEFCKNALSQIGVQQASRWDALKALAEMTKNYSDYEYKALTEIIAQRRPINQNSTTEEANAQETLLAQAMSRFNMVVERYPELKANEMYNKTMDSINMYENQVRTSRMVYNDTVTKYNQLVRQFPSSIVASILGFKTREYLVENVGKEDMPSMSFNN